MSRTIPGYTSKLVSGTICVCNQCGWKTQMFDMQYEAEERMSMHLSEECVYNPGLHLCGSCKHYQFARVLVTPDECYDYGVPEGMNRRLRLCNYIDNVVTQHTPGCKNWAEEIEWQCT